MSHPSAVLRGLAISFPVSTKDGAANLQALPALAAAAIRRVYPRAQVLATLSTDGAGSKRVLTISGRRQRTLRQWRRLIADALAEAGAEVDWRAALVLRALPDHR